MYVPLAEEDRWRRIWRDLRGPRPGDQGSRRHEARVGQAAQAGAQDGGRRAQATAG